MTSSPSTFCLSLTLSRKLEVGGRKFDREEFFAWLWRQYGGRGLLGVHEGTLLSEQAAEQGFETESFISGTFVPEAGAKTCIMDAAQAPRDRDWIAAQGEARVEAYFASESEARVAREELLGLVDAGIAESAGSPAGAGLAIGEIAEQKPEDWDAEWKRSFLNASDGVAVPPFWRILPAWVGADLVSGARTLTPGERALLINPGAGFGTGTHETTQLCLQAIGEFAAARGGGGDGTPSADAEYGAGAESGGGADRDGGGELGPLSGMKALDFGSGSGILAIGAALLGARVAAVEIDELAVDNARENARLNGVEDRIEFSGDLATAAPGPYPLVIANILRPVLVEFAPELVGRLEPGGCLVLSGLIESDVPEIERVFSALMSGHLSSPSGAAKTASPRVVARGEWRAVVWG